MTWFQAINSNEYEQWFLKWVPWYILNYNVLNEEKKVQHQTEKNFFIVSYYWVGTNSGDR